MSDLTQEELKKALHYDPKTGIFRWKVNKGKKIKPGNYAGYIKDGRYIVIQINGKNYYAHRLAWLYTYGYWPNEIDHINKNKVANKIENLRECTRSENVLNNKVRADSTSKIKGVGWNKHITKWIARITVEKKTYYLGTFDTKQEAAKARRQAEQELLCH